MSARRDAELCPDASTHTPGPEGYLEWHAWAEKKEKTHVQSQCPRCGFWVIWTKKVK